MTAHPQSIFNSLSDIFSADFRLPTPALTQTDESLHDVTRLLPDPVRGSINYCASNPAILDVKLIVCLFRQSNKIAPADDLN
jgi:hypothetical protein